MTEAPVVRLIEADIFERQVGFRFPFRFGAARVESAPQAFVRVSIADESGHEAAGWSAEMMMPKWFDKNPALSPDDNVAQLRASLHLAIEVLQAAGAKTPFGLHAAAEADHHRAAASQGLPPLVASYGLALIDRAVIDAVCRMKGASAADAVRHDLFGITNATAPDLAGFDLAGFFSRLEPSPRLAVRHTIGLADALTAAELASEQRLEDGLPQTLEGVIAAYGHRYFKIKVSGRPVEDLERLMAIAAVLDRTIDGYRATLDGNEQFESADAAADLLDRLQKEPRLSRLRRSLLFFEQPIARAEALSKSVAALAERMPLEIDESDGDIGAFPRARELGYAGISSKSCKGFYRALINRARVEKWNREAGSSQYFMSAEDLTTQSGLALQQDLVLAALVGTGHVERNGHHYVDGMAQAPTGEQASYLAAHPDLYDGASGRARLVIKGGELNFGSALRAIGLGSLVEPDWASMTAR
ncbi:MULTISPECIES: enolase C-terminal domain-like protein [unclassified Sinorhizobium]|uniref:enolase C-terminal domain-like protein n=1 Tax=unclassified Sinorhizobium TaxID=2613772 RepID=UPI0024C2D589|nr:MULTISPECIES: enolase C-terminal domain-like protein [unclassified Sinorhizobium]MDK1374418.1 mandelate racemase [Sinorhizobium sp. 6-70]MDK1478929.1 mandelate racemase [Sinorhizobium sp. 6-117]